MDNAYKPEMVTGLVGYDNNGAVIPVEVVKHEKNIAIVPTDKLGVTATNFDYGYWTKDKDGKTVHNQSQKYLVLKKVHMLSNMTFTIGMQKQNL